MMIFAKLIAISVLLGTASGQVGNPERVASFNDFPRQVKIHMMYDGLKPEYFQGTGTLVESTVSGHKHTFVLTAAHLFSPVYYGKDPNRQMFTVKSAAIYYKASANAEETREEVLDWRIHHTFDIFEQHLYWDTRVIDIAVMVLETPVEGVRTATLPAPNRGIPFFERVRFAGYGSTRYNVKSDQILREGTTILLPVLYCLTFSTDKAERKKTKQSFVRKREQHLEDAATQEEIGRVERMKREWICTGPRRMNGPDSVVSYSGKGDSGCGLFRERHQRDRDVVYGVQMGGLYKGEPGEIQFARPDQWVQVVGVLPWINQKFEELGSIARENGRGNN